MNIQFTHAVSLITFTIALALGGCDSSSSGNPPPFDGLTADNPSATATDEQTGDPVTLQATNVTAARVITN